MGVDNRLTAEQLAALGLGDTVTVESAQDFRRPEQVTEPRVDLPRPRAPRPPAFVHPPLRRPPSRTSHADRKTQQVRM
jgi:hypothetical protein